LEITLNLNKYKQTRYYLFKRRYELNLIHKATLAFCFACLTGLLAQLRLYLPWTPVPITGQVFAVFLAGILLGKWWGGFSQCLYTGLGIMGLPWFAGFNGGLAYISGPTSGYLIGFIIAAFFLGYCTDKYVRSRYFFNMLALMLFATFILIYIPGLLWLYLWLGASISILELLIIGMAPYFTVDLIKAVLAAAIGKSITPKRSFNMDIDINK
jgi:biotin transport system substrate-specific component